MNEQAKTQVIRLVDVFLLGPFMIWAATRLRASQQLQITMAVAGLLTILYNAGNYLANRSAQ